MCIIHQSRFILLMVINKQCVESMWVGESWKEKWPKNGVVHISFFHVPMRVHDAMSLCYYIWLCIYLNDKLTLIFLQHISMIISYTLHQQPQSANKKYHQHIIIIILIIHKQSQSPIAIHHNFS